MTACDHEDAPDWGTPVPVYVYEWAMIIGLYARTLLAAGHAPPSVEAALVAFLRIGLAEAMFSTIYGWGQR